ANDVAVSGALPRWLSCGFIIEEGLPMATLEQVAQSMAATARAAGIQIVTGDTKVVPRGAADKIFINTAGLGAIPAGLHWGARQLAPGDVLLVSGTLGDHGATILNLRENLGLEGELASDCALLSPLIQRLRDVPGVKALRDATRGGVNAVAHEFAASAGCGIELQERALPLKPAVRGVCELLGLDALNFANEGKLVIGVARESVATALSALHAHPLGREAAVIGEVVAQKGVRLAGLYGVKRTLDLPHSEPLPRIC
ncbi:hydrogenase expression/formation protein HypE, partial [Cronobacter muytjensii]